MRGIRNLSAVYIVVGFVCAAYADCTCAAAKVENGWCGDCKLGYFATVQVKAKKLFEALAGHAADDHEITCDACKKAMKSDGYCQACNIGFVGKKHYHSKVAYALAKGESMDPAKIACEGCRKAAEDHGWCEACKAGMVGNVAFKERADYDKAVEARKILVAASKSKCEACAVAMVADGECTECKVAYKDGKKVEAEQP